MKQVVQNYRTGELTVEEVPVPAARPGGLLVRTVASVVSAGTEKSKVDLARKSLLGKARARPDQVKKVLDTVKREGLANTYSKIRNKLDSLSALGYSAAGEVIGVGEGCEGFSVGDAVACAGAGYANHAEAMWVPKNLCAPIPAGVSFEDAAFATVGAIALQGIRQAEATFGETVAVIGLGLLGQLTVQMLHASGCRVIGIDIDPWKVEIAKQHGVELALLRSDDVVGHAMAATGGAGVDSVIVTAAAPSNDPFILAGDIARDRAHVVLVGAVPIDVPRSPYYEKELDVRLSRSYGPGRYDVGYEEHGEDYPIGYVRWTENRNLQAFLGALKSKAITLGKLVTHRIPIADAERAYDLIMGENHEPFLGVVLNYGTQSRALQTTVATPGVRAPRREVRVGFVGAGSFAGGTLIPALKAQPQVALERVCTSSGITARDAARRHGFAFSVSSPDEIIGVDTINAVFIATRHDTHSSLAVAALAAGKAVFVEKPLALTAGELERVAEAAKSNAALMVGYNRRFSPHARAVRDRFARCAGALVIDIRVNAGPIPASSWIQDPRVGGGRILGEVCHFVDLVHYLTGSATKRVYCANVGGGDPAGLLKDNISLTLELASGSVATIVYTSKGDMAIGKERVEVFGGGMCAVIEDFHTTTVTSRGRSEKVVTKADKGHREEIARFVQMVSAGGEPPIPLADLLATSRATIAALESATTGSAIAI